MNRFFRMARPALCFALLLFLLIGCAAPQESPAPTATEAPIPTAAPAVTRTDGDETITFAYHGMTATVDKNAGFLTGVQNADGALSFGRVYIDLGIDGKALLHQLGYIDMGKLATYELPTLYPRMKELPAPDAITFDTTGDGFAVDMTYGTLTVRYGYTMLNGALALSATLSVSDDDRHEINGVGFVTAGIEGFSLADATFEFPGSTPSGRLAYKTRMRYRAESADYAAPVVQLREGDHAENIVFVDEIEKWTTASWSDENQKPCVGFLAACEGYLTKDKPMTVGTLYLPLHDATTDAYDAVAQLWTALGYHTPTDTTAAENLCAIYSAHPFGTMDTDYFNRWTLAAYAERIQPVADMGFDAIWLLPVFSHTGDNVYEPIDQAVIDPRYGGEAEAKTFIDTAHGLGLKVLFDFVPHGPRPVYPFAKEHPDWIAKDKDGKNRIEWDCVSMDYNHPDYAAYNVELTEYYAEKLGLDGARIDCSMGGLPNWNEAVTGVRASAAGLMAGRNVVSCYREGFKAGGANVLLLPENFHPSPAYAAVTDVFYDMPLYRTLFNLNHANLSDADFTAALTAYLEAEHRTSVPGQLKLRFLGNHDTVTWTFDAARAQVVYGTEKAKALWTVLGWIDGVIFAYQGDEDPATYRLGGENLEAFFTDLIAAKRAFVPNTMDTAYLYTGSAVFACKRTDGAQTRLVLVNLSDAPASYPQGGTVLAAIGDVTANENGTELAPYAGVILDMK